MNQPLLAAIELGGTKTICLVGQRGSTSSFEKKVIPTTTPEETLDQVTRFFQEFPDIQGIGIGAFGPINIVPNSPRYGVVENTPKPGWTHFNLYQYFTERFSCPVIIDTDVNAAALGEYKMGAGRGLSNFVYVTVGTGIGGSAFINGQAVKGLSHPEMGHTSLPRHPSDVEFAAACRFHPSCAEGLASGKAISKRWGKPLNEFPEDSEAWALQAYYLSEFFHNLILMYSPQRIISGGGVSSEALLTHVRKVLFKRINGYVPGLDSPEKLDEFLVLPELKGEAGPLGSFLLNQQH